PGADGRDRLPGAEADERRGVLDVTQQPRPGSEPLPVAPLDPFEPALDELRLPPCLHLPGRVCERCPHPPTMPGVGVPRCLTIAGSDSGGGAGIQADLKAFAAAGCHGSSAIVALTAQNTVGVTDVLEVPPEFVRAQLEAVFSDVGVDAAKTGMLFSATIIETV